MSIFDDEQTYINNSALTNYDLNLKKVKVSWLPCMSDIRSLYKLYLDIAESYIDFFAHYWYEGDITTTESVMRNEIDKFLPGFAKSWCGFASQADCDAIGNYVLNLPYSPNEVEIFTFLKEVLMGNLEFRCRYPIGSSNALNMIKPYSSLLINYPKSLICIKKQQYLTRYNGVSDAIAAAVQHNSLYKKPITSKSIQQIHAVWDSQLTQLGQKYTTTQSLQTYYNDVENLKNYMNQQFSAYFGKNGFKISHAQKSLSVYLKHLWCAGKIAMPPVCPIDRTILAKIPNFRSIPAWTAMNSIAVLNQYVQKIDSIANQQNLSIAEWELINF